MRWWNKAFTFLSFLLFSLTLSLLAHTHTPMSTRPNRRAPNVKKYIEVYLRLSLSLEHYTDHFRVKALTPPSLSLSLNHAPCNIGACIYLSCEGLLFSSTPPERQRVSLHQKKLYPRERSIQALPTLLLLLSFHYFPTFSSFPMFETFSEQFLWIFLHRSFRLTFADDQSRGGSTHERAFLCIYEWEVKKREKGHFAYGLHNVACSVRIKR